MSHVQIAHLFLHFSTALMINELYLPSLLFQLIFCREKQCVGDVSPQHPPPAPPSPSYTVFSFTQQLWSRCDCLLKLVKALFSSSNHFQANNLVLNSGNVEINSGLFMPNREGKYVLGVANDVESKVIKIPFSVLLIITYIWLAGGLYWGGEGGVIF